ncbi:MAG TPA: HD domain-containing phosphohydrolase [Gemmatimonadales bacterium]|nr:HD domain-containing phosphohydrolase [Gemmatimonadales bacterium]
MRFVLYHPGTWSSDRVAAALAAEQVELRRFDAPGEAREADKPTAFILDGPTRRQVTPELLVGLRDAGVAVLALGEPGETDIPEDLPADALAGFVRAPAGPRELLVALRAAFRTSAAHREQARARAEGAARLNELTDLAEIGVLLTTEKNLDTLLELILSQARRVSQSDAGSLYIVETDPFGVRRLRFKLSQNESRPDIPFVEFTIPIDHSSLAGYAATEGEPLVIEDVYMLPPDVEYSFNRSFDERYGYRTKSMLVLPMQNHYGEVIGVLQLINRKRDPSAPLVDAADAARQIIAYSPHTLKIVKALAGQAAVSIENSQLYEAIERLFEGFVKAAVHAIEQRDPTTSGHSERVAVRTVALAEAIDRVADGPFASIHFSREQVRELRYAGLLHDFGKVGVREQVLVKAKKLYDGELSLIRQRHAFIRRSAELVFERERAEYLLAHGRDGYEKFLRDLTERQQAAIATADRFLKVVMASNEPTVLAEGDFAQLGEFAAMQYQDIEGAAQPYLTEIEQKHLSIRKGSLDDRERLEIESHVNHTFAFLKKIPWTRGLVRVPEIALGHHEKLDGSGYPRHVLGEAIPLQTRMMTIADIFDALTAQDRPYKRALPATRALDILTDEVERGQLDPDLFRIFIEARIWEERTERRRESIAVNRP